MALSTMTIFTASLGSSLIVLIYKMASYRFDDAKLHESGNPVSYTDHTQLTMYYMAVTLRILSMFSIRS